MSELDLPESQNYDPLRQLTPKEWDQIEDDITAMRGGLNHAVPAIGEDNVFFDAFRAQLGESQVQAAAEAQEWLQATIPSYTSIVLRKERQNVDVERQYDQNVKAANIHAGEVINACINAPSFPVSLVETGDHYSWVFEDPRSRTAPAMPSGQQPYTEAHLKTIMEATSTSNHRAHIGKDTAATYQKAIRLIQQANSALSSGDDLDGDEKRKMNDDQLMIDDGWYGKNDTLEEVRDRLTERLLVAIDFQPNDERTAITHRLTYKNVLLPDEQAGTGPAEATHLQVTFRRAEDQNIPKDLATELAMDENAALDYTYRLEALAKQYGIIPPEIARRMEIQPHSEDIAIVYGAFYKLVEAELDAQGVLGQVRMAAEYSCREAEDFLKLLVASKPVVASFNT